MNFLVRLGVLGLVAGGGAVSAQAVLPHVYSLPANALGQAKAHPTPEFVAAVRADADSAMKVEPHSVVEKSMTPPSGDKHDYTSLSRYFWPNPATANHLPYVRRDGESNPEIKNISDHDFLTKMGESVRKLALGWYVFGDEKYAEHAAKLLRVWFLDPATAMRPNLNYAQFVPGQYDGRGSGILDAREFVHALDGAALLEGSKAWSAEDAKALHAWFAAYYEWLATSANGKHEKAAPNNHGSWYAAQEATIARYLGKDADVKKIAEIVKTVRIPSQFDKDGLQKYELVRTNSFSYSAFNLEALTELAQVAAASGVNLYAPEKPGAPGILTGLDALLPFDPQHKWTHAQLRAVADGCIAPGNYLKLD